MGEVNEAVIKKTQETLGKFVKRPPLTDKLLMKPPFRFLHDVINVVRLFLTTPPRENSYRVDHLSGGSRIWKWKWRWNSPPFPFFLSN